MASRILYNRSNSKDIKYPCPEGMIKNSLQTSLLKMYKMEEFKFGDIIDGKKTNHPIIFFSIENDDQFCGCIITHAGNYDNNFPLHLEHFTKNDENGNIYKVQFENSYFANITLEKQNDWGPFVKVGSLTAEGIEFVRSKVIGEQSTSWKEYIESLKKV